MSDVLRCRRCFAPKNDENEICEFCGLDPIEYEPIARFNDELMEEFLKDIEEEDVNSLEGLSLDEKIRRVSGRM